MIGLWGFLEETSFAVFPLLLLLITILAIRRTPRGDGRFSLKTVLQHRAYAHQPLPPAQQQQYFAALPAGTVHHGKISLHQKFPKQLGIPPVVLLPPLGELPDAPGIAHSQFMAGFLYQPVEPHGISTTLDAHNRALWQSRIETTHIVTAVI